ncbi:uncharacterized protein ASPGLDRAFT_954741 [Aspergillus glaucus CBS 516.65]|uniref:Uncharacterized protein n=1 Tax=Aspergillus glaucus CBS 516.65 TaxID=1160497 RepID=A0A1L9V6V9_ASPGL|nr:hypothetical protein ASPGLDRAFT_954741 [Aspergillus glaucus CBS 516.65]OJJ79664.1 hypothetical protein ASPGLDRAFT_954741 [Aspergillus glaucus CBS 516.65]
MELRGKHRRSIALSIALWVMSPSSSRRPECSEIRKTTCPVRSIPIPSPSRRNGLLESFGRPAALGLTLPYRTLMQPIA